MMAKAIGLQSTDRTRTTKGILRMRKLLDASGPRTLVLVRLLVGWVFIAEGVQKFIFADELGAGRFAKIGIPWPAFTGPFVGLAETLCGVLVIAGFLTRFAALVLLLD